MRNFVKILAVVLLAATSCSKDDSIIYGYEGFGTVSGTNIILDDGITAIVRNIQCDDSYVECDRILVFCDLLMKEGPDTYGINLRDWKKVLKKPCLVASEVTDWEAVGDDPVNLVQGWTGSEFLNMELNFSFKADSETSHFINLVYDDVASDADTLRFTIRHNGYGESYPDIPEEEAVLGRAYTSFPVTSLIPEGQDKIAVKISWKWHKYKDGQVLPDTEIRSTIGSIHR